MNVEPDRKWNPAATKQEPGNAVNEIKSSSKVDPFEREIERAGHPGAFIRDGQCFSFEEMTTTVDKLITTDPTRAVELYETFLAGCHAKADELDDSSGALGQFARDANCGWIKARQGSVAGNKGLGRVREVDLGLGSTYAPRPAARSAGSIPAG